MGDRQWHPASDPYGDRFAKPKAILARIFGDGENPLAWGFTIAQFRGTRIRIHLLFVVYLLSELIFTLPGNHMGLVFVVPRLSAMVLLVLLHELARAGVCRRIGGGCDELMLWPLGGLAPCEIPRDWRAELGIAGAGPILHLALIPFLAIPLYLLTGTLSSLAFDPLLLGSSSTVLTLQGGEATWWLETLRAFYSINMVLLVFNLLVPMYPLDAARIMQALIWKRTGESRSMWLATNVGLGVATLVGLIGIVFDDGKMLLAIAIFGGIVCSMQRRRLQFLEHGGIIPGFSAQGEGESWKLGRDDDAPRSGTLVGEDDEEIISRAQLDRILAKISVSGIGSLSRRERRTLKRATQSSRKSQ